MEDDIKNQISEKLLHLHHLKVKNTSKNHKGHDGYGKNSHFEILIVADDFINLSRVVRHRFIFKVLGKVAIDTHSISLKLFTIKEYENT